MLRENAEPERTRPRRGRGWIAVILLAAAAGAFAAWQRPSCFKTAIATLWPAGCRDNALPRGANVDIAIPIHAITVTRGDFPVTLSGLGTVQAWNTVTVRSRVDGQVEKISSACGCGLKSLMV
jgi:membrane fusion protein, multidrug efflux system